MPRLEVAIVASAAPLVCRGYPSPCGSTRDVRFDEASLRFLCIDCWSKVDPENFGVRPRTNQRAG